MNINFEPAALTLTEARGLVAMLREMYPDLRMVGVGTLAAADPDPVDLDPAQAFATPAADPVDLDPAQAFATPVPTSPATPAAGGTIAPSAETDTDGLPWDARIHASTKGKNADGRWKARRNTPADTVAAVTAELRALMGVPTAPLAPAPPATTPVGPTPSTPTDGAAPADGAGQTATIPASPSSAPPPPPPPVVPAAPAMDFPAVMRKVTAAQATGAVTPAILNTILADLGLGALRELVTNPDKITAFSDQIDAYVASAG